MPARIFQEEETLVLRQKAEPVSVKEIPSSRIQKILKDMKKALEGESDGVAIAAPQIGVPLRIFVVSGRVRAILANEDEAKSQYPDEVFINPKILRSSRIKKAMEEGCLSVRWLYGKVKRSDKVELEAYDEKGKKFSRGASGLVAQIFQHESDHLDGVLFTDKASDLHEWKPVPVKSKKR